MFLFNLLHGFSESLILDNVDLLDLVFASVPPLVVTSLA
jgi:hypothetical protein